MSGPSKKNEGIVKICLHFMGWNDTEFISKFEAKLHEISLLLFEALSCSIKLDLPEDNLARVDIVLLLGLFLLVDEVKLLLTFPARPHLLQGQGHPPDQLVLLGVLKVVDAEDERLLGVEGHAFEPDLGPVGVEVVIHLVALVDELVGVVGVDALQGKVGVGERAQVLVGEAPAADLQDDLEIVLVNMSNQVFV